MKDILLLGAALVIGFVVVVIIEAFAQVFFPLPVDIDPADTESLAAFIDQIPVGALLIVALAHLAGVFSATYIVGTYAKNAMYAYTAVAIFAIGLIANLMTVPHPLWFIPVDIAAFIGGGTLGLHFTNLLRNPFLRR